MRKHAQKEFCDSCKGQQRPTAWRPSTHVFGAWSSHGRGRGALCRVKPRQAAPVLNIIDCNIIDCAEPLSFSEELDAFMWSSATCDCDQGREFLGGFAEKLTQMGSAHKTIRARASWQQQRFGGVKLACLRRNQPSIGCTTRGRTTDVITPANLTFYTLCRTETAGAGEKLRWLTEQVRASALE